MKNGFYQFFMMHLAVIAFGKVQFSHVFCIYFAHFSFFCIKIMQNEAKNKIFTCQKIQHTSWDAWLGPPFPLQNDLHLSRPLFRPKVHFHFLSDCRPKKNQGPYINDVTWIWPKNDNFDRTMSNSFSLNFRIPHWKYKRTIKFIE